MKLFLGLLCLVVGCAISIIAGFISVKGMVAIFAANAVGVAAMMASLEIGKIVAATWLKFNWGNTSVPRLHKAYLTVATAALMLITSIGIFGYLSAGHLEQKAPLAGMELQQKQLESQIQQRSLENTGLQARLAQIDKNVDVFLQNDKAAQGMRAAAGLKTERDQIQKKIDANNEEINGLNAKLVPMKMESGAVEAKLGPVKYVAALFGWDDTESAVRLVILTIMMAFDPLAIMLIISAMITLAEVRKPKPESEEEVNAEAGGTEPEPEPDVKDEAEAAEDIDDRATRLLEEVTALNNQLSEKKQETEEWRLVSHQLKEQSATEVQNLKDGFQHTLATIQTEHERELEELREAEAAAMAEIKAEFASSMAEREEEEPVTVNRESVLKFLETNPDFVTEIASIFRENMVEEMSDREKLLDLLENNPSIINDMAGIITSNIIGHKKDGDSWL